MGNRNGIKLAKETGVLDCETVVRVVEDCGCGRMEDYKFHVWCRCWCRPELAINSLSLSPSTLSCFETGNLTEPGVHVLAILTGQTTKGSDPHCPILLPTPTPSPRV